MINPKKEHFVHKKKNKKHFNRTKKQFVPFLCRTDNYYVIFIIYCFLGVL